MATPAATLPALDKIYLIGIWIESVLWSMNCVFFVAATWVTFRKRGSNRLMLGVTSFVLFAFVTTHVAASLRQLLEAFIYIPAGAPADYSSLYWLDATTPMAVLKDVLYDITVFLQDIVLIWRLYVVWNQDWRICVLPVVVELAHMSAAFGATYYATQPTLDIYSPSVKDLGLSGWALDLVVNIFVTVVIAGRLWLMGSRVATISSRTSRSSRQNVYLPPMFTIIESGALFATVTIVMLGLYLSNNPFTLSAMNIATQLAALTPLLIIVRVGLGLTHGLPNAYRNIKNKMATDSDLSTFEARSHGGIPVSTIEISTTRDMVSTTESGNEHYALEDLKFADSLDHGASKAKRQIGVLHAEV